MNLLTAVCYVAKDISAVVSLLMIIRYIFLDKLCLKKSRVVLLGLLIAINGFVGVLYLMKMEPTSDEFMDFVSNVIYVIAAKTLTERKKLTKIIWIVMLYVMTVDMLYSLVSSYIPDILFAECAVNIVIFCFVCISIYIFAKKSRFNMLSKVFDEIPGWVFGAVLLFDLACYYKEFGLSADWYNVLYIISSVMVVICVLYLFFKIFKMSYEQTQILRQMEIQRDYSEKVALGNSELRNFRHDYKNHMIVINAYLDSGRLEEAKEYIEKLNQSVETSLKNVSTGNFVVDAVINNKINAAAEKGIKIRFNGTVPEQGIDSQDLCQIFSNLLDNAIEACEKLSEESEIDVESGLRQNFFILSVSNPCLIPPEKQDGVFKTTKADKQNHGIGLKNVTAAAEKYSGALVTECIDGVFCADVRMRLKQHTVK